MASGQMIPDTPFSKNFKNNKKSTQPKNNLFKTKFCLFAESLLDLDWTKMPYAFVLISLFIISRIPLLNSGFGLDPDAWRLANSAFDLGLYHSYHISRFPGFPIPEFVNSLVIKYGWLATNTVTMAFSLLSVFAFSSILKNINAKNKGLLVLTYAFFPFLWIISATTMDYIWSLSLIMLSWLSITKNRYGLAGFLMGLSIGCRLTSVALVLPLIYLILNKEKDVKKAAYFTLLAAATSMLLFLPLFINYGFGFLTYYPSDVNLLSSLISKSIECFGFLSIAVGTIFILISMKKIVRSLVSRDGMTIFLISAIAIVFALFLKAPYEAGYIIPIIPFGLLFASRHINKKRLAVLCVLILSTSVIQTSLHASSNTDRQLDVSIRIDTVGVIENNIVKRNDQIDSARKLMDLDINHSVVLIRSQFLPMLSYFNKVDLIGTEENATESKYSDRTELWISDKDVLYTFILSLDDLLELKSNGYEIYCAGDDTRAYIKDNCGYNLDDYNCTYIDV
jgi:hypothetical protein